MIDQIKHTIEDISNDSIANVLSISGGKDSTAMLLHAIERNVDFIAVFVDTGNEHQLTLEYIDYLQHATGVKIKTIKADYSDAVLRKREVIRKHWPKEKTITIPGGKKKQLRAMTEEEINNSIEKLNPTGNPFLDLVMSKGRMPSTINRFCSIQLKQVPMMDQVVAPLMDSGKTVCSWQGVRADESTARSNYEPAIYENGIISYRPILMWNVAQVFAIHKKHGVEPNPLYKMGMSRVGCMPCIHCCKSELKEIARRFPEEIKRIDKWETMVAEVSRSEIARNLGKAEFFGRVNPKQVGSGTIKHRVAWANSDKGMQINLITELENEEFDETACSAVYPMVCE